MNQRISLDRVTFDVLQIGRKAAVRLWVSLLAIFLSTVICSVSFTTATAQDVTVEQIAFAHESRNQDGAYLEVLSLVIPLHRNVAVITKAVAKHHGVISYVVVTLVLTLAALRLPVPSKNSLAVVMALGMGIDLR